MIVRILSQGQWVLDEADLPGLNEFDAQVEAALTNDDAEQLTEALTALLTQVRAAGHELPDDVIADSDLILPDSGATLTEVRSWLDEFDSTDGFIPG